MGEQNDANGNACYLLLLIIPEKFRRLIVSIYVQIVTSPERDTLTRITA